MANQIFDFIEEELDIDLPLPQSSPIPRYLVESRISPLSEIDQIIFESGTTVPECGFVYTASDIFSTKAEEAFNPAIFYLHELATLLKKINDSNPAAKKDGRVYGEIVNDIGGLVSSTIFMILEPKYGQIRGFKISLNNHDNTESCEISGEGFNPAQIKKSMKLSSTVKLKNPKETFIQILEFISLSTEYFFSQNEPN